MSETETPFASPSLTITVSLTPGVVPTEPALTPLFTDNFDSGDLSRWTLGKGWLLVNRENGQALQVNGSDEPVTLNQNDLLDVAAQISFAMNAGAVRLSVRQSEASAYSVMVDLNGNVSLQRGDEPLGAAIINPIAVGESHTLYLSAIADVLHVRIDNTEVIAVRDADPMPLGTLSFAGAELGKGALRVDDVVIWSMEGIIPATSKNIITSTPSQQVSLSLLYNETFNDMHMPEWLLSTRWESALTTSGIGIQIMDANDEAQFIQQPLLNIATQFKFSIFDTDSNIHFNLRQSKDGNYKTVISPSGRIDLYKGVIILQSVVISPIIPGTWHKLLFSAIGGHLQIIFDEIPLIDIFDDIPLPAGTASFYGSFASEQSGLKIIQVDDLLVWGEANDEGGITTPSVVGESLQSQLHMRAEDTCNLVTPDPNKVMQVQSNLLFSQWRGSTYQEVLAYLDINQPVDSSIDCAIPNGIVDNPGIFEHTSPGGFAPSISPTGSLVAYTRHILTGDYEIYLLDVSTGVVSALLNRPNNFDMYPSWSPDGQWIVFTSATNDSWDLYKVNVSSPATVYKLTSDGGVDSEPTWSPDGTRILYTGGQFGGTLYTIPATCTTPCDIIGNNQRQQIQTPVGVFIQEPTWSPDGQWIAYISNESLNNIGGNDYDVWIQNIAIPSIRGNATARPANLDRHPTWSLDGNQIAFSTNLANSSGATLQIWRIRNVNQIVGAIASGASLPARDIVQVTEVGYSSNDPRWALPKGVGKDIYAQTLPIPLVSSDLILAADNAFNSSTDPDTTTNINLPMTSPPGTCDTTIQTRQICAAYAYTTLYALFQQYTGNPPTVGFLLAIVYQAELGNFQGSQVSIEALSRSFFNPNDGACPFDNSIHQYNCTYDYVIRFPGTVHSIYSQVNPLGNQVRVDFAEILGMTTLREFINKIPSAPSAEVGGGMFNSDASVFREIQNHLTDWPNGWTKAVDNRPSIWGNKIVSPAGTTSISSLPEYNSAYHWAVLFVHRFSDQHEEFDTYGATSQPATPRNEATCTYVTVIASATHRLSPLSTCSGQ